MSEFNITSEHSCHWKDAFESTSDELLKAREDSDAWKSKTERYKKALEAILFQSGIHAAQNIADEALVETEEEK